MVLWFPLASAEVEELARKLVSTLAELWHTPLILFKKNFQRLAKSVVPSRKQYLHMHISPARFWQWSHWILRHFELRLSYNILKSSELDIKTKWKRGCGFSVTSVIFISDLRIRAVQRERRLLLMFELSVCFHPKWHLGMLCYLHVMFARSVIPLCIQCDRVKPFGIILDWCENRFFFLLLFEVNCASLYTRAARADWFNCDS